MEIQHRRSALYDIVAAGRPMTVRQVFYAATVRGTIDKSEAGYGKVQTDLVLMRRAGMLPYDWLADAGSDVSVELDAIDPERLRSLVETAILAHLPLRQLAVLREAEASERDLLHLLAREVRT
jgi:hypothetical protein